MSLLPSHKSKFDKKFDEFFGTKLENLDITDLNTLAHSAPASLLPILAYSFDVSIDGLDENSARQLLKNAFEIHYYSGTLYSLNKALNAFFGDSKVSEWFDYNGLPYHFRLDLDISKKGVDRGGFEHIDYLVEKFKNVRSVLDGVSLRARLKITEVNAVAVLSGETVSILPFVLKNKMVRLTQNFASCLCERETYILNVLMRDPYAIRLLNLVHTKGILRGRISGNDGMCEIVIGGFIKASFESEINFSLAGVYKSGEKISVFASDKAGNKSRIYEVLVDN